VQALVLHNPNNNNKPALQSNPCLPQEPQNGKRCETGSCRAGHLVVLEKLHDGIHGVVSWDPSRSSPRLSAVRCRLQRNKNPLCGQEPKQDEGGRRPIRLAAAFREGASCEFYYWTSVLTGPSGLRPNGRVLSLLLFWKEAEFYLNSLISEF
jgi:hypothetical protein